MSTGKAAGTELGLVLLSGAAHPLTATNRV
jgi:hypothetical protein